MIVTSTFRLALRLLPAELRLKHGPAMEALFAREFGQARARGRLPGALAGAAGVWDVVARAAYEQMRPNQSANTTGSLHMPLPTTRQLVGRHVTSFAIAFLVLTALLLFVYGSRQIPALRARGVSPGTIAQALLFAVPFTAAMTIPMAVFLAVLHEFTKLGADGTLAAAVRVRKEVRRLIATVLAAAVVVAAVSLVVTAEVVPLANQRLSTVLRGEAAAPSDRSMTIGELRAAAKNIGASAPDARSRAAAYEVEVQKKFALPAACLVLATAGMTIAFRFPRGGTWMVIGASLVVFSVYYAMLMTGESLADRLVISPTVGMWGANGLLLSMALLAAWWRRGSVASAGPAAGVLRG